MNPTVCAIVLCYNGVELTLECIESLRNQTFPKLEIIIIDNDSPDHTAEIVSSHYPESLVINSGRNLGYVAGNNLGIQIALEKQSEYFFLVNNDTKLDPDCVTTLVNTFSGDNSIGVLGPMVYIWDQPSRVSSAGGQVNWKYADAVNVGAGEEDHGQFQARSVDFVNGCGIMVTRQAVDKAGVLDPKFFMYWEETDWCQRIYAAGFKIYFEPEARMWHNAPIRSDELGPTTIYYMTRNRFLFFYRHTPMRLKPLAMARAIHGAIKGYQNHRHNGRMAHARATQLAIQHAIQNRWGWTDPQLWSEYH
jgi:hypothetical protein